MLLLVFAISSIAVAKEAQPSAADPVLEARVMKLSKELRCLQCQNETLAEPRADLAEDLRGKIREQMRAGKSDQEILALAISSGLDRERSLTLLFDPEHALDERIAMEQFAT